MDPRAFVGGLAAGLLGAPLATEGQQAGKVARIGFLTLTLAPNPHLREAFLQRLRDLGYVEGRNVVIEYRDAEGKFDYPKWFPRSRKARTIFAPPPPPPMPAGPPAFATFARDFVERRKVLTTHAHYADLKSLLETHLIPFFGEDRPFADGSFTIDNVEKFVVRMKALPGTRGEKMSGVRVNKARALLGRVLGRAVANGWLKTNPVLAVSRLRENPADIDPLSWTDVRRLLDKGLRSDREMRRFYTVAIFTGLRTSELIALRWVDIDWTSDPPTAVIKHSFMKGDGHHLTKTPGSARAVELRPAVVQALKQQQAASRLKADFVFCNAIGGPLDRDNVMNRVWYPALERAGIRARKPYQARHTFATLALSAGEAIGWVSRQMGHANTKMVIEHYYRFIPNLTRRRVGVRQGGRTVRTLFRLVKGRKMAESRAETPRGYGPVSP